MGLTLASVKATLGQLGLSIRKTEGEYRVAYRPQGYTPAQLAQVEATAYYTTDLQDALDTGAHMATQAVTHAQ